MSDTLIDHPLVRGYLRALDTACAGLPAAQARELHEQLAAHLEEVLPSDASLDDITAELDRLGPPHVIAAEAVGPGPHPAVRKLRNRVARVRWWVWAVTAVVVAAIGTGVGFIRSMNTAASLNDVSSGWLYSADQADAVATSADGVTQTTVPNRFRERQGIELLLVNNSDWTQEIIGPADGFQPFSGEPFQVSVRSGPHLNKVGDPMSGGTFFASPGFIPPHSFRRVQVSWVSDTCMGGGSGSGAIIDQLLLQVRVGTVTRTENIPLNQAFELAAPVHSTCR